MKRGQPGGILDKCDPLFGNRSDVKGSYTDATSNWPTCFSDWSCSKVLATLATNLRSNLDEAFTRRLDAVVDFPMPEEPDKRALWQINLTTGLSIEEEIDLSLSGEPGLSEIASG